MTVGRDVGNGVVINDAEISRRHARLVTQAGGYVLEDLGSTNGTFVNGQRLMGPHLLRHGEVVMFGENVSLVFEALQFDPNATVMSPSSLGAPKPMATVVVSPPAAPEAFFPPQPEAPVYAAQMPPEPAPAYEPAAPYEPVIPDYQEPAPPKKSNRTLMIIGIGCLVILLCACVAGAIAFDSANLYCEPPFNGLFNCP
jgi:pSer/pThr/pTyr-binding forkhead associated (FHA) protein